jgi:MurNAc alpha-1-phosphate uridylyltransferase
LNVQVVILAGGLATRLRPITERVPKALVDVNGEPFICHQLRLLQGQGFERVVLCLGHLGEMVRDFVGTGSKFAMDVKYSFDGETLRGTAGAIRNAWALLEPEFLVLYGDSYLTCSFLDVEAAFLNSRKAAQMTVFRNEGKWDRSNVEFIGGQIVTYDKIRQTPRMNYIDYGLGAFRRDAFERISCDEPYDLATLYQQVLQERQLAGLEVADRFYEIGSLDGLEELRQHLQAKETSGDIHPTAPQ